jgi:23S rRNA (cytidine1920-2'-O)/16S rRNA (cytidine1409-2'-O)-methyltransferase
MARVRLDKRLVDLGLCESRSQAVAIIEGGLVLVNGSIADKITRQVDAGDQIVVFDDQHRYVSRGAWKLRGALDTFAIDVSGRFGVDAGSSTGGFSEVLLERGAAGVLCVDVGTHQLHERLRNDERVVVQEETNVKDVTPKQAAQWLQPLQPIDLVVGDLSFTSLEPLMPALVALAGETGDLVLLAKPQFEVGKAVASKGKGVIRHRSDRRAGIDRVVSAISSQNAGIMGVMASPIRGTAGNAEFLLWVKPLASHAANLETMIERALDAADDGDA